MYAIVKTGGKQYRVERGQKLLVERLAVAEGADEKLRVFKFKPKRGYKRRTGHRQNLTQIEVTEITAKAASAKAAAKASKEKASDGS